MHWCGYIYNTYQDIIDKLEWFANYIDPKEAKKMELVEAFLQICSTRAQVAATFMGLLDLLKENKIFLTYRKDSFVLSYKE